MGVPKVVFRVTINSLTRHRAMLFLSYFKRNYLRYINVLKLSNCVTKLLLYYVPCATLLPVVNTNVLDR